MRRKGCWRTSSSDYHRHENAPYWRQLFPGESRSPIQRRVIKQGWVCILTNKRNGTLYIGVTSNLPQRIWQHREALIDGFTRKYGLKILVWFEHFDGLQDARRREVQMKGWKRAWKIELIEKANPEWRDLYPDLLR
ncbi:GIY-YIG nuclease family protein [Sphingopyxis sp. OPL5]|nr:GIY-YIG nuclease family protein [Sphingopyxis sp. OPL5]